MIRFILVSLGALMLFSACTKKSATTAQQGPKIGFVLATMNEERYAKDRDYFVNAAAKEGATVVFADCDDKVDVQTSKVESLLAQGIDVLVVQPVNGNTAASIVQMAKADGVPVVAYDRLIKNAALDLYVTQDSFRVGVLQAEEAVKATGGKGNFVLLMGESGHSVAEAITRGNLSVLEKHPDINVVVRQSHAGWATALALSTTENALTRYKNQVHAILANNDGMAMGAAQALEEQKLTGRVFVAGADADLAAIKNILKGKQSITVLKGIKPLAEAAVVGALQLAKKEAPTFDTKVANGSVEVPTVNTPVFRVVRDNIRKQIVEYGFHPEKSVYGAE